MPKTEEQIYLLIGRQSKRSIAGTGDLIEKVLTRLVAADASAWTDNHAKALPKSFNKHRERPSAVDLIRSNKKNRGICTRRIANCSSLRRHHRAVFTVLVEAIHIQLVGYLHGHGGTQSWQGPRTLYDPYVLGGGENPHHAFAAQIPRDFPDHRGEIRERYFRKKSCIDLPIDDHHYVNGIWQRRGRVIRFHINLVPVSTLLRFGRAIQRGFRFLQKLGGRVRAPLRRAIEKHGLRGGLSGDETQMKILPIVIFIKQRMARPHERRVVRRKDDSVAAAVREAVE
jgi:hypothetical protein